LYLPISASACCISSPVLIEIFSANGELLDTAAKRRGYQKLFFRVTTAESAFEENKCTSGEEHSITDSTNAEFAENLRKNMQKLTQNMRITKVIPRN